MSSDQRKSRRRFLADMLFLGGGLTAAGLLAKSQLLSPEPEPVAAGAMVPPSALPPEPVSTPVVVKTPEKCVELPPEVEGGMKLPPPQPGQTPVRQTSIQDQSPMIAGGRTATRPPPEETGPRR